MYLKTLTLRGFKSFASATTLRFEPGITCVVGPNGSGKSNVVDALAWVMGEQGAKSLRGGKMEDVIFAGTSSRPPLGRAEVTLTIDNTDGALPIDYTEVTISRLMFRSGQSEYAINGDTCRLLDVQELLSDSGIGREMHVIVGQGQLDARPARRARGPPGVHRGGRRRAQAPQAQGEGAAQAGRDAGQPDPRPGPHRRAAPPAQAARPAGRDRPQGRRHPGRPARRPAAAARRRRGHAARHAASGRRPTRPPSWPGAPRWRPSWPRASSGRPRWRPPRPRPSRRLAAAQETWFRLSSLRERAARRSSSSPPSGTGTPPTPRPSSGAGRDPEELEREAAEVREQEQILRAELDAGRRSCWRRPSSGAPRPRPRWPPRSGGSPPAARAAADRREGLARLRGQVESRCAAGPGPPRRRSAGCTEARRRGRRARASAPSEDLEAQRARGARRRSRRWPRSSTAAQALVEEARAVADEARAAVEQAKAALDAPRAALAAPPRPASARPRGRPGGAARRGRAARPAARRSSWAWPRADGGAALLGAGLAGVLGPLAASLHGRPGRRGGRRRRARRRRRGDRRRLARHRRGRPGAACAEAAATGRASPPVPASASPATAPAPRTTGPAAGCRCRCAGASARWAVDLVTVPGRAALGRRASTLLAGVVVVDDLRRRARRSWTRIPSCGPSPRDGDLSAPTGAQRRSERRHVVLQVRAALDEAVADLADGRGDGPSGPRTRSRRPSPPSRPRRRPLEAAQARVERGAGGRQHRPGRGSTRRRARWTRSGPGSARPTSAAAAAAKRLAQLEAAADAARARRPSGWPERHGRRGGPRPRPGGAGRAGGSGWPRPNTPQELETEPTTEHARRAGRRLRGAPGSRDGGPAAGPHRGGAGRGHRGPRRRGCCARPSASAHERAQAAAERARRRQQAQVAEAVSRARERVLARPGRRPSRLAAARARRGRAGAGSPSTPS